MLPIRGAARTLAVIGALMSIVYLAIMGCAADPQVVEKIVEVEKQVEVPVEVVKEVEVEKQVEVVKEVEVEVVKEVEVEKEVEKLVEVVVTAVPRFRTKPLSLAERFASAFWTRVQLDPMLAGLSQGSSPYGEVAYDNIVMYWYDGEITPWAVESWTSSEDLSQYTFNVRDGINFHSGNPLTSADINTRSTAFGRKTSASPLKGQISYNRHH